ncbi:hypothetical protein [Azospirillum brasilense]|uniref:hypothetical protein n=1 Tax=Azospirillum brasilense TaxID=192 RepID=UPI0015863880|nr:hypothetical protein [Azospirillum brasilense]
MFMVTEREAAAIRQAFDERGEWVAVTELRRFFRVDSNEDALRCVHTITGWTSPP